MQVCCCRDLETLYVHFGRNGLASSFKACFSLFFVLKINLIQLSYNLENNGRSEKQWEIFSVLREFRLPGEAETMTSGSQLFWLEWTRVAVLFYWVFCMCKTII